MKLIIEQLLNRQDLSKNQAFETMNSIMNGEFDDAQISGFLVALRSKGETVDEITGFAMAMREKMVNIPLESDAVDLCGTGGDSSGTFNISTAASFVVAGAGIKVAKHGNRSMTSKSGSADVLQALGMKIDKSPDESLAELNQIGLTFMFAPAYHPAMKYAMGARKSLAIRTVFNRLGPVCNPANVTSQAMGIFNPALTETQAEVLKQLGSKNVMVFSGIDGLDEISTTGLTKISQFFDHGDIKTYDFYASDIGLEKVTLPDLNGGMPEENAKIIKNILEGEKGPKRDIVALNAAAGIWIGGKVNDLRSGLDYANEVIESGAALNILKQLSE